MGAETLMIEPRATREAPGTALTMVVMKTVDAAACTRRDKRRMGCQCMWAAAGGIAWVKRPHMDLIETKARRAAAR